MAGRLRLRTLAAIWVGGAFIAGIVASTLWFSSTLAWQTHLERAYSVGVETFAALESGNAPSGVEIALLTENDLENAQSARFERIDGVPRPACVTLLSLKARSGDPTDHSGTKIAVLSDRLQYRVAEIEAGRYSAPALKFGELTRLLATYCSAPVIFASTDAGGWVRINGGNVWGCDAAPRDYRLSALVLALLAIAVLVTNVGNTAEAFVRFSDALRSRTLLGGPESYEASGPKELFEIVQAVNANLEAERAQLSKRATILSGVSHDLGTPATRLRLRAALIEDPKIREKLEADIDQMTDIIESVLTYTRSELNSEEPIKLSLSSLVEALVAAYQDTGEPVHLQTPPPLAAKTGRSVFASRAGSVELSEASKILMHARPIALRRAVSNLIDNALKYGRRATVTVTSNAEWAIITVDDAGGSSSAQGMETLLEPFERGENTESISGFGLGLTIVATIARQHGGKIEFEDLERGLRAKLWLRRVVA